MDPRDYRQPHYPASHGFGSPPPHTTDFTHESHPQFNQYLLSPETHHSPTDRPLGALPAQYTAASFSEANTFPMGDGFHPLPMELVSPVSNNPVQMGVFSDQPQHAYPPYAMTHTIQFSPTSEDEIAAEQEQVQPVPRELLPQVPYKSSARKARFKSSDTIEFIVNGERGIRLSDALDGNGEGLHGRDDRSLFKGNRPQIIVRIQPVGCKPWHSKIHTRDFTANRRLISRTKLALEVAKSVSRFIEREKQSHTRCDWGDISAEHAFLTQIVRVSVASWQPEILVEHPSDSSRAPAPSSSSSDTRAGREA